MKFLEWFFGLFISKKRKFEEKQNAYSEMVKANESYLNAKAKKEKYLSKYSGRKRYQKA